MKMNS